MNNEPIMFNDQQMVNYFNLQPSDVKGRANEGVEFYKRQLYTKLYSVYKFTLPDSWKLNHFRYWLFHFGSIGVIYTNEFGWVAQPYSILELDINYNPKKIQVYNQFIKSPKIGIVGLNAGVIHVMDDYFGLDDLVTKYAVQLSQCDKAININLMNCNVSVMFEAENKKQADSVREAYAQATEGKPLVVLNNQLLQGKQLATLLANVGQNYIVDKLINARLSIMNAFLTEVGIDNANLQKRERLNSDEVNANNEEVRSIAEVILENLNKCFDVVNSVSGLGLAVEFRHDREERDSNVID